MLRTFSFTGKQRGLVPGAVRLLAAIALPVSAVQAQSDGSEIALPPTQVAPLALPLPQTEPASAYLDQDGACQLAMVARSSEASALGCAFEDTTLGFTLAETIDAAGASIEVEASFARGTSGAFTLDHIMRGFRQGMNAETTLGSVGVDATLLDGRIEWESKLSWSREWQTPVAASPVLPRRFFEETGTASQHRIKATLIDRPGLKWSVDGRYEAADDSYRPYFVSVPDRLFTTEGRNTRLGTRIDWKGWDLKASRSSLSNPFLDSSRTSFSVSNSGITARWNERRGRSSWEIAGAAPQQSETRRQTFGLDISTFELAPLIAVEDTGFASLVPKTLTIELENKTTDRLRGGVSSGYSAQALSALGLWTTPLGDTIVNFRTEARRGTDSAGRSVEGRESFVLVSHSFYLGDWSIDLDYMSNRDAARNRGILDDGSSVASFGVGARYKVKGMPAIDLRVGRDMLDMSAAEGALQLRDRSLRAEAEVDFSPWLQRKLERDDMQLKLAMQWDFDSSGYEVALFDEVIDSEYETRQGRGAMLTFVMQLR